MSRVEVGWDMGLAGVLELVGVRVAPSAGGACVPAVVGQGLMAVEMDEEADARLEELINRLSELRWRYEAGRRLQMELWADGFD